MVAIGEIELPIFTELKGEPHELGTITIPIEFIPVSTES